MNLQVEHLLWEAVRRNEKYKIWYEELRAIGLENIDLRYCNFKNEIIIKLKELKCFHEDNWYLLKPCDPSISTDDIDCEISEGIRKSEYYPYSHIFGKFNRAAAILQSPKYDKPNVNKMLFSEDDLYSIAYRKSVDLDQDNCNMLARWAAAILLENRDRALISVNPFCNNDDIVSDIAEIKDKYFLVRHMHSLEFKTKNQLSLAKLEESMRHLLRYDKIIKIIYENKDYEYKIDEEIVRIPENFQWEDIVSGWELDYFIKEKSGSSAIKKLVVTKSNKTVYTGETVNYAMSTIIKKYRGSYDVAVELIKNSFFRVGVIPHKSKTAYKVNW